MSYIGSIGPLTAGSGLKEILEKAFGSVSKMLTGKKVHTMCESSKNASRRNFTPHYKGWYSKFIQQIIPST